MEFYSKAIELRKIYVESNRFDLLDILTLLIPIAFANHDSLPPEFSITPIQLHEEKVRKVLVDLGYEVIYVSVPQLECSSTEVSIDS